MIRKILFVVFAAVLATVVGCGAERGGEGDVLEIRRAQVAQAGDKYTVSGYVDGKPTTVVADVTFPDGSGPNVGTVKPQSGDGPPFCLYCSCRGGRCQCWIGPCED